MRFAFDGLPRDLPLSREERRQLVARMKGMKPTGHPVWVALVPAGVMLMAMGIVMPAVYLLDYPWRWVVMGTGLILQVCLTHWIMRRGLWPYRCKQMAIAGCEVCPRCGYLQRNAPPEIRMCSECGAKRIEMSR